MLTHKQAERAVTAIRETIVPELHTYDRWKHDRFRVLSKSTGHKRVLTWIGLSRVELFDVCMALDDEGIIEWRTNEKDWNNCKISVDVPSDFIVRHVAKTFKTKRRKK